MDSATSSPRRSSRIGLFPWLFPLRTRLEAPEVLVVEAPISHYLKRGLISLPLFALLILFLALLFNLTHPGSPFEAPMRLMFFAPFGLAILFGVGLAVGMVVGAPILSRRTVVRFDRGRGVVVRARDGLTVPLRDIAGIGVSQPKGFMNLQNNFYLVLVRADGTELLALHGPIPGQQTAHAQEIRRQMEAFIGLAAVPPVATLVPGMSAQPREATALGYSPNVAAGFCYIPIAGIGIFISIIMLCCSKDRMVRFAAKQSLLHLACWFLFAIFLLGGLILTIVIPEGSPAHLPVMILGIAATCIVFVWYHAAWIVACVRAFRGRTWVMPWLRWLIGKSAPSTNLEASKTR